ncbi:MAG: primosomal protein N' [Pseudoflavonifractor sp.]|nr:primosomal protein N' [Alloprevotella sp.]MCM1117112.1 primosomal protein N' [Pseudoflavonifractor sp.]
MFAEVILPLPLPGAFTYHVPDEMVSAIREGHRVTVPFGKKKLLTGIVAALGVPQPAGVDTKDIDAILDDEPILRRNQLKLWQWVADYYFCAPGDVMKAALPAGLKLESETFIELDSDWEEDSHCPLTRNEVTVIQALDHAGKHITMADLEKATGLKSLQRILSSLIDKRAVTVAEKVVERFKAKHISCVRLAQAIADEAKSSPDSLTRIFDAVKGAPRQEKAMLALIEMSGAMRRDTAPKEVTRAELMERADVTAPIISALEKKGLVETYRKTVSRFTYEGRATGKLPTLSPAQSQALKELHQSWMEGREITLLHGVTSSGKTELYIHLMDYVMRQGRQALMLVPEIALTTQLTERLQRVFGDKVIVYHSKFSDNERVEIWRRLLTSSEPLIVIGARSSLFLPYSRLGLVIVDEEHDSSYKQQDPAPRYNARDTATVLARMHGAKTLLGSATPAIDTYYKALSGKYSLVELKERYGEAVLPSIETIDLTRARLKGELHGIFSARATQAVRDALNAKGQAIIFLNRRGFAPMAVCKQCAWTPKCDNCDVSLTYHRALNSLVCHYCGARYPLPSVCPACKTPGSVEVVGYGTERVEDEADTIFPDVKIARMDLDSTRAKDSHQKLIDEFSSGKARILIGTQMVTKGLDFGGVNTVVVANADAMLSAPDFRATERSYAMLEQVAGRAGRRPGSPAASVLIQTRRPDNPIFPLLSAHDYRAFYDREIEERRQFRYPPFARLVYIYIKHRERVAADALADTYGEHLRAVFSPQRVTGPDAPPIGRVQNYFIRRLMLKIEPDAPVSRVRELLMAIHRRLAEARYEPIRRAFIYYDVDPM